MNNTKNTNNNKTETSKYILTYSSHSVKSNLIQMIVINDAALKASLSVDTASSAVPFDNDNSYNINTNYASAKYMQWLCKKLKGNIYKFRDWYLAF